METVRFITWYLHGIVSGVWADFATRTERSTKGLPLKQDL